VYVQAANVLRGIRELTVANGRATAVRGVESARREMVEAQRRVLILSEGPRLVLEVTLYASVLVALFLSLQSSDPSDTLPLIALYVVAAMRLVPGVARMLGIATQVRSSIEIGLTVLGELHELEEIGERHISPAGDLPDAGDLVLDGVSFEYVEGVDVLSEITLEVPRGEMVGIVGPSGSGKTTLVSVMLGLLPPTRGTVTFGGAAIGTADPSWMSRIAYVPQDVYIADASVRENVALGDDEPDDARVWSSLARAHLDRVVREIPDGLDARLHEGGARLSVGQRQRLGIARALYRRAQVLLLDEPTAALDSITEGQVVGTLLELKGELTMIVVAHRLSTIADADRVVELKDGALTLVP
jgi:ABC-type multidrug transport system fused ATPase/permease subunit